MSLTLFMRQSLEHIQNEVVRQDFPERMMANGSLVPIVAELPVWIDSYTYRLLTSVGSAKITASGADDIPEVGVFAEERTGYVRNIRNKFSYTYEDAMKAQQAGVQLTPELAIAARESAETELDNVAWNGSAENKLMGFLGHANVPSYAVPNDGTGSSTLWANKTPEQRYRDLTLAAQKIAIDSKYTHFCEVLLMDTANYALISQTPYPASTATETILTFFLKTQQNNPFGVKKIMPVPYLNGIGTGGSSVMIGYMPRPQKLKFHLPMGFTMNAPKEFKDEVWETKTRMRTGGLQILKFLSMLYVDGI